MKKIQIISLIFVGLFLFGCGNKNNNEAKKQEEKPIVEKKNVDEKNIIIEEEKNNFNKENVNSNLENNNQNYNSNCTKTDPIFGIIAVASKCYETALEVEDSYLFCINCGDGICSKDEDMCSCSKDCKANDSTYETVKDFCKSDEFIRICKEIHVNSKLSGELCNLCK